MSVFDQRNQTVTHQHNFNVSGNVNFGAIQDKASLIEELKKLQSEINTAISQNSLEEETAIDVNSSIQKAIIQAEKPVADKTTLLRHITTAKNIVTSVTGLADVLGQAYEKIRLLF